MSQILVDSNILLDVFTNDAQWGDWSEAHLAALSEDHELMINPMIYAEIAPHFVDIRQLEHALGFGNFHRAPLPWEAAFLAAKCHVSYRMQGGSRSSTLPDFFIGAHAAVSGMTLLTRDHRRYTTYYPQVKLIHP